MAGNPILHHVNLKTSRLQEMIDWYSTVTGMKVSFQFPGGAWLSNDEANHRLALIASPNLTDDPDFRKHVGMHHAAFEYASIEDLLANYSRLKADGIEPHLMLDHGVTMSFYYVDPDGSSVELQADNFGDWAKSKEWMKTSPQFADNPIGVPVDPQQMVDALAAGTPASELHDLAYAGKFQPESEMDLRVDL